MGLADTLQLQVLTYNDIRPIDASVAACSLVGYHWPIGKLVKVCLIFTIFTKHLVLLAPMAIGFWNWLTIGLMALESCLLLEKRTKELEI